MQPKSAPGPIPIKPYINAAIALLQREGYAVVHTDRRIRLGCQHQVPRELWDGDHGLRNGTWKYMARKMGESILTHGALLHQEVIYPDEEDMPGPWARRMAIAYSRFDFFPAAAAEFKR